LKSFLGYKTRSADFLMKAYNITTVEKFERWLREDTTKLPSHVIQLYGPRQQRVIICPFKNLFLESTKGRNVSGQ
jgi:hypothetical protein